MLNITINGKANAKAETFGNVKALKTVTHITYPKSEDKADFDCQVVKDDVEALGLNDSPLASMTVDFADAKMGKRLHNRCLKQFARIGITGEDQPWEDGGGEFTYTMKDMEGSDAYFLTYILLGMFDRSRRKMSHTQHSITWYDILQAVGAVHAAQQGDVEALEVKEWADGKVGAAKKAELEALKKKRAAAKAATKAAEGAKKAKEKAAEATGTDDDTEAGNDEQTDPDGGDKDAVTLVVE